MFQLAQRVYYIKILIERVYRNKINSIRVMFVVIRKGKMIKLEKSRKYKNRKKWVTVSTLAFASVELFTLNNNRVDAEVTQKSGTNVEPTQNEKVQSVNNKQEVKTVVSANTKTVKDNQTTDNQVNSALNTTESLNVQKTNDTKNQIDVKMNKLSVASDTIKDSQIASNSTIKQEIRKAYIGIFTEPTKLEHVNNTDEHTYKFNNLNKLSQIDIKYNIDEKTNTVDSNPGNQYPSDFLKYEKLSDNSVKITINPNYQINGQSYEFDNLFGQAMDSSRLDSAENNNSVVYDQTSDSYVFNLGKLASSMATTAAGPGEGYQLFVKAKGHPSAINILHAQNKHSNEAMVNWYSQDDGSYIGSTIFDDYSMGAGYKELSRAYDVQYGHSPTREELDNYTPDPLLANVEDTKYWIKTYNNTSFYYDRTGVWDGTYNDDLSKGELGGMPVINTENTEAVFDSGFHSLDLNNGKTFNVFRAHISLNGADPNDSRYIPRIFKSTGYVSAEKIPYFINYHYGEDGNDKTFIASFTGKLGSTAVEVTTNIQGAFLGKQVYPNYNLNNAVKLPLGYTFQNFNFDTHDFGIPECEKWQSKVDFTPDISQADFVNQNLNRKYEISKEDDWDWVAPHVKIRLIEQDSNKIIKEDDISFDKNSGLVILSKSNLSTNYGGLTRVRNGQYGAARMPYYLVSNFNQLNERYNLIPNDYVINSNTDLFKNIKYKNYQDEFGILNDQLDVLISKKKDNITVTNTFRYMDGDKQVGQDIVAWGEAGAYLSTANQKKLSTLPAGYELATGESIPVALSDKTEVRVIKIKKKIINMLK